MNRHDRLAAALLAVVFTVAFDWPGLVFAVGAILTTAGLILARDCRTQASRDDWMALADATDVNGGRP
jgi:hypothetical protein